MKLEQLIGSNSFGSAMKQPFMLRRLDTLTLALFLVWCLSPLGSQGLQRAYYRDSSIVPGKNATIQYLDTLRENPLYGSGRSDADLSSPSKGTSIQLIADYFTSAFLPQ
jgi:hypothetical protein